MLKHDPEDISFLSKVLGRKPLSAIEFSDTVWEPREEEIPVGEVSDLAPLDALVYGTHFATQETPK